MWAFGQRMHKRREQIGMSQLDLARLTGMPQARLSEFEHGVRTEMTVSTALKIARALGVGIDYLAGTFDEEAEAAPAEAAPTGAPAPGARRRGRPRRLAAPARAGPARSQRKPRGVCGWSARTGTALGGRGVGS